MRILGSAAAAVALLALASSAAPPAPEAEKSLRRAAERGDARAAYELGRLYARGGDLAGRAEHWYREAAARGNADARRVLADIESWRGPGPKKGREVLERAKDCSRARGANDPSCAALFVAAANEGSAEAQCDVGKARLEAAAAADFYDMVHDEAPRAPRRAQAAVVEGVGWLRSSAEQGWPEAQFQFGRVLEQGVYAAKDAKAAAGWYRRAADQGHVRAWEALERFGGT